MSEPMERLLREQRQLSRTVERMQRALGRLEEARAAGAANLVDSEFQVYSQWGEDGILQHLCRHVLLPNRIFVEFGVESYREANTRWLLVEHGWSGLVIDGSEENVAAIKRDPVYWRHQLKAVCSFVTKDNIDSLIEGEGISGEIGLLSVDIDGVDYWVWQAISCISPAIVVAEYNSLFGPDRAVTVPYREDFVRSEAHYSNSYYGASLRALELLGGRKGYALVGSNSAGNNAFFVRRDLLAPPLHEVTASEAYVKRSFREARNQAGNLAHPTFEEEAAMISHLPLVDVSGE